jgi:voltage-gated potassium channel
MQQRLELPLMIAALLTIPAIIIEESALHAPWDAVGVILNWAIWSAFFAELVLMLATVTDRREWLRTHPLEIAVVVLTPPFLPSSLQAARLFRLLRVLRMAKALSVSRRLLSTEGIRDAAVLTTFTVLGGGAAYAAVEKTDLHGHHLGVWDGVWWAMTTVTTVGYGDLTPQTTGGRLIAMVVMLVGIGFVAVLTAAAASRFLRDQQQERSDLIAIEARLDEVLARLRAMEARDPP